MVTGIIMGMITGTAMTTEDADLLALTHWLSPVFPVGGFAYSHGIETLVAERAIHSGETLQAFCTTLLTSGSARSDAVLLMATMRSASSDDDANAWAEALAASSERHRETTEQGAAFTHAHNALSGSDHAPAALPVAVGRAARALSLAPTRVAAFYLQAMMANLVTGAVRHIPLGQSEGQAIIKALAPVILSTVEAAKDFAPPDIFTSIPGADLAAMRHETLETRIFRT